MHNDVILKQGGRTGKESLRHPRPRQSKASTPGEARGTRATVLVVDDEPSLRTVLTELLEGAGYEVLSAENGQTALSVAAREQPALVLTDCTMPDGDGAELIRRLREQPETRHIPVVAMSSLRSVRPALGDVPFIEKPFDLDDVLEVVAVYTGEPELSDGWWQVTALEG